MEYVKTMILAWGLVKERDDPKQFSHRFSFMVGATPYVNKLRINALSKSEAYFFEVCL